MDIILSFLVKSLDKHGITLVHITYPFLKFLDLSFWLAVSTLQHVQAALLFYSFLNSLDKFAKTFYSRHLDTKQ